MLEAPDPDSLRKEAWFEKPPGGARAFVSDSCALSFVDALRDAVERSRDRARQGGLADATSQRELRCLELELAVLERRGTIVDHQPLRRGELEIDT